MVVMHVHAHKARADMTYSVGKDMNCMEKVSAGRLALARLRSAINITGRYARFSVKVTAWRLLPSGPGGYRHDGPACGLSSTGDHYHWTTSNLYVYDTFTILVASQA